MPQQEFIPDVDTMFPPYRGYNGNYGYRRSRKKQQKAKVQFFSYKDHRTKPSRVMWIHRKTKKRKGRLAKLKHTYNEEEGLGLGPSAGRVYDDVVEQKRRAMAREAQGGSLYLDKPIQQESYTPYEESGGAEEAQGADYYRRKHSKKRVTHKLKKRAKKKKR